MSIKQRTTKSGKTVFDIRVRYDGIRISRTVRTTMTDARCLESKILQDLIHGNFDILTNKEDPRFSLYSDEYLKSVKWQKSFDWTETSIKNLKKFFGQKRLSEITEYDLINYRSKRLEEVSGTTINRERSCLLRMLNVAVKDNRYKIKKNPISNVKPFKEFPVENRVLSVEEYHKILNAAKQYFKRIIFFACQTGLRKMEILNLKFKQIKLSFNVVEVELLDTKSGHREYVPINNSVIELIEKIAVERKINYQRDYLEKDPKSSKCGNRMAISHDNVHSSIFISI